MIFAKLFRKVPAPAGLANYLAALGTQGAHDPEGDGDVLGFNQEVVSFAWRGGYTRHTTGWSQPWIEVTNKGRRLIGASPTREWNPSESIA